MRKLLTWLDKNILKIGISFLLFFIPLYPKLPLFDIKHTWVYVRLEDLFVALLIFIFFIQLARKKATLKTPLSLPIFLYWLIGGISLVFSIFVLSPHLANFFPKVAILHFLRRIEYMILFFVAFSTVKSRKDIYHYLAFFAFGVCGVVLYGFGQKFLGLPAFLTMNEEFAKGIPLFLPPEARTTSTFAGHYDLAAYLVFALALFSSLIFGLKSKWKKLGLFFISLGAYFLLLFTASRISFVVYLIVVTFVLFLQRKKWLIVPVVLISIFLMKGTKGASIRFEKTFRVKQVVYDVNTGKAIATLEDFLAVPTSPAEVALKKPPPKKEEELPLGTGFLEIPLLEKEGLPSALKRVKMVTLKTASEASHLATISGDFLVKRAIVYDISFTTRFQGGWPRALKAFKRNILLGSGYSSISLATDNDYLRFLGETGILGLLSFLLILFIILLIAHQGLRKIKTPFARSVIIGVAAGIFGLSLNAVLIDVFEASKVAYVLWMMVGIMVGLFSLLVKKKESLVKEAIRFIKKPIVSIILLGTAAVGIFYSAVSNYFTADDFTWLKWAAETEPSDILNFFIDTAGGFYRPLIKVIFYLSYQFLGLKPYGYHLVSFILHFSISTLVYLIAFFLTSNSLIALLSGFFFLLHPIHGETIFWISGYSGLFAAAFYLLSFYLFLRWAKEKRWIRQVFYLASLSFFILSLASYELAVTLPIVLVLYFVIYKTSKESKKQWFFLLPYFISLGLYLILRNVIAQAHFLSGDYNYNLGNFILNFFGNLMRYLGELILGFRFIPFYDFLRESFCDQKLISALFLMLILITVYNFRKRLKKARIDKLIIFSLGWIIITLLPVIGLDNVAERYLYIPSVGFVILLSILINKFYRKKFSALVLVLIMTVSISGFYYLELKRVELSWKEAGEISNEILRALSTNYKQFPKKSTLYFVNLPLKVERAWVFPVGIEDGLWFIYKNDNLNIMKGNNLSAALDYKKRNKDVYVFVYQDGELREAREEIKK